MTEFQLQLFDGKRYTVAGSGDLKACQKESETAPRPWRIVKTDKARPDKPAYRRPTGARGSGRLAKETIRAYLGWAQARGLPSVTFYATDVSWRRVWQGTYRFVPVADFLGPAPEAEPCEP